MAYRRRPSVPPTASPSGDSSAADPPATATATAPPTLAAKAMRASAAHRDVSSISSAYGEDAMSSPRREDHHPRPKPSPLLVQPSDETHYEYTSMKNLYESKYGFWGTLARKAKSFIDDETSPKQQQVPGVQPHQTVDESTGDQIHQPYGLHETNKMAETPRKSAEAITSSLNFIGGTIKNAFEEGLMIVENKTADIIHETRKLNIRKKGSDENAQQSRGTFGRQTLPHVQTDHETQLKASRDVANAMAAKAKLLLRELKTIKADLAFARERCAQLEEENRVLRESQEKGDNPEDDDLIRLQLETLLAEKARLANENSVYARENRFLREIVEFHQLTMQDVVYVDEGIEEVTEVYSSSTVPSTPSLTMSEPSTPLSTRPFTRTLSNPAFVPSQQTQTLVSPSIVIPEDCPIVPTPPILSPMSDSTKVPRDNWLQ